ncbi:MAG TPA: ATP-binding protein [Kouleothrix sp.]|uniref:sensor histidine kinase n=1 Tax=Kouleothrix sp. TaxID=2779161 RepID=UPI002CA1D665|nr:ATP-binding protein [Kouleothrix sp.]
MTALDTILLLAFLAALATAIWLWRRRLTIIESPPPPAEQFTPMFRVAADALDAGLVIVGAEREVRYLNQQAELLLGIGAGEATGAGLISVVRDYQADTLVQDVLRDGEARELVLQPIQGGRTLRLRARSIDAGDFRGVALLIRDVTQLNLLERARRDMVANVSHELRTPLASVKLLVETLQSAPPPPIAERMLTQMAQEVDAVTQLVDELHELSQIESGRVALKLAPTQLEAVTSRAIERIRPQAERKSLRISAEVAAELPPVLMDAGRIGQVLLNLLHNAIKFTPEGGAISVRATVVSVGVDTGKVGYVERRLNHEPHPYPPGERRQRTPALARQGRPAIALPQALGPGDWMQICVSDTGIGIPRAEVSRVFERFYKVDRARTRNAGGTGLGLAIAKHLVEGHGGCIWAISEEGAGSTFSLMLPLA